jgi:hypothetical protein
MYGQLGLGKNKNTAPGALVAEQRPRLVDFKQQIEHITCGLDNTILATRGKLKDINERYCVCLFMRIIRWLYLWYGLECRWPVRSRI